MGNDVGNGGSWLRSKGGGGRLSVALGEFVLLRINEPSEGENIPRGGYRGLKATCAHGCGVVPVPIPKGVVPVGGIGQSPFGVYPEGPDVPLGLPVGTVLTLSPGLFEGGVRRFPTLTFETEDCWFVLIAENERYFCDSCGGGSSKFGRFDAACRRAVKLEGAFPKSSCEPIPGCWTAADAMGKVYPRPWSDGGRKTSLSADGGVGSVVAGRWGFAPGQN